MDKFRKHFRILLGIYIVILIWGILLKMSRIDLIEDNFYRAIERDLFLRFTYTLFEFSLTYQPLIETYYLNFFVFVPFGFLVASLLREASFLKVLGISFLLSLIFETSQFFTSFGGFVTFDLILNSFGGAVGFIVFAIFDWIRKQFRQEAQEKITMGVIIISYVCFVPLAVYGVAKTIYHIDFYLSLIEPMINSLK